MNKSRFEFLEKDFPSLYDKCIQAEQALAYDVVMLKLRQVLEYIVHDFGVQNTDLFQDINELEGRNVLDQKMSQLFHSIRRMANQAIHEGSVIEKTDTVKFLNDLLRMVLWFGIKKGKTYTLEQFTPSDVLLVRTYLAEMGELSDKFIETPESGATFSVDPLRVEDGLHVSVMELQKQEIWERDVFETQEEYEQRITNMEPIHIGYGILDTRRKDGYTNIGFLIHHIDHNPHIHFSPVSAFYTDGITVDQVVDDELVSTLKVYKNEVCCDYSGVYLRNKGSLIPIQPICWDKLSYENDAEYENRISQIPMLPFGEGIPIRNQYNIETGNLPVLIKPYQYAKQILKPMLPQDSIITIQCNRDIARAICSLPVPCIFFSKLHTLTSFESYILWGDGVGEVFTYERGPYESMLKHKIADITNNKSRDKTDLKNLIELYEKGIEKGFLWACVELISLIKSRPEIPEEADIPLSSIAKASVLIRREGDAEAQYALGKCYYSGYGVPQDYRKAVQCFLTSAKLGNIKGINSLANCYSYGKGVKQDYEKAEAWFQQAVKAGSKSARFSLDDLRKKRVFGNLEK